MLHQVSSPWENAIPSYFICHSSYPSSSSTVQKLLLSIRYYYSNVLITYGRCTLLIKSCPQNTLGLQGKKDAKQNGCRHLSPAVHGNSGQDDSQIVKLHLSTVLYEKKKTDACTFQRAESLRCHTQTGRNTWKIQCMKLSVLEDTLNSFFWYMPTFQFRPANNLTFLQWILLSPPFWNKISRQ